MDMEETISFIGGMVRVKYINNGTLVLKEHHLKYCECEKGEIWTGDGRPGCRANFKLIKTEGDAKFFRCQKTGILLIVLKSSEKELKKPDEMGLKFVKIL